MTDNRMLADPRLSRRAEFTAYSTAFISVGLLPMFHVIGPLWALYIGASPFLIGVAVGARSLLPFIFAIHSGALLDRLGVHRVMTFCALLSAALTVLYPVLPFIVALVVLQALTGFLHTIGWIGAQTQISQLTRGNAKYMGRFTSVSTFSNFFTPPLAGLAWDLAGPWGAFSLLSLWNLLLWLSVSLMPVPRTVTISKEQIRLRKLLPSYSDYNAALRLAIIPAIGFVVACSFLLNSLLSMRFGFLPVYMQSVGFDGTIIGLMVGFAFLIGGCTALPTARIRRLFAPHWVILFVVGFTALGLGIVPLFQDIAGLSFATVVFGAGAGLGMAFAISLLSTVVPTEQLGLSIGLRITANRFSSFAIPIFAGAVIDGFGIAAGFYATAIVIGTGLLFATLFMMRTPSIKTAYGEK
ncbi:MFS transporter [Alphaproteobacteria bacterium]|nr:MFS transporter [Alphaproteobacteria bacterium]